MNWQGWIFMFIVWGLVGCLFFYAFYHILSGERIRNKKIQNKRKKGSKG